MNDRIVMFYPYISDKARQAAYDTLGTRWIGEGPQVKEFEKKFGEKFGFVHCVAVNSGTSALNLAYHLAGIKRGDKVITTPLTCSATNIPLLHAGARVQFADIHRDTLNIDINSVCVTNDVKAIVVVHVGGCPVDMNEIIEKANGAVVIEDAAHAIGVDGIGKADFTIFSFQAIKHITTVDGGMLVCKNKEDADRARLLRWFGIDRDSRLKNIWEYDIQEAGFKYHMNDIAASIGLAHLKEFDQLLEDRKRHAKMYREGLKGVTHLADKKGHAYWLYTILTDRRKELVEYLESKNIEASPVHFRNDIYSIFGGKQKRENMDWIEDKYLSLPIHNKMTDEDINRVIEAVNEFTDSTNKKA